MKTSPIGLTQTVFTPLNFISLIRWRNCVPCITAGLSTITPDDNYTSAWTSLEDKQDCGAASEWGD